MAVHPSDDACKSDEEACELWMHTGSLESTQEARVALSYM